MGKITGRFQDAIATRMAGKSPVHRPKSSRSVEPRRCRWTTGNYREGCALCRSCDHMVRRQVGKHWRFVGGIFVNGCSRRRHVCQRRACNRAPRALRPAPGRGRWGKRSLSSRPDHPRCRPRRGGDVGGANGVQWARAGDRRGALRWRTHRNDAPSVDCTDRCYSSTWVCSGLALLERRIGLGTFLLVWTIVAGTMDNFLRPILIRKGADLPLLLVFAGVIGGLIAFGLIGIFVGPVVLAVAEALLRAWIDADTSPGEMTEQQEPTGE